MGYDITAFREGAYEVKDALDRRATLENASEVGIADVGVVAYLHTHMDAFHELAQHGYDWFDRLGASDHDGGVSGMGRTARIPVETLRSALIALRAHEPGPLKTTGGSTIHVRGLPENVVAQKPSEADEWKFRKIQLDAFMSDCIAYCESAGQSSILIEFA